LQQINRGILVTCFLLIIQQLFFQSNVSADEEMNQKRLALYKKTEAISHIPWYYLAALDRYERNINEDLEDEIISIQFPDELWFGFGNSDYNENIDIIELFDGIGRDGNGDGKADPTDPEDILYATAFMLSSFGFTEDDIKIGLWEFYQRDLSVKTVVNIAKIFKHFQTIELIDRDFPVSIDHNYSFRTTWGHRRGFGGNRIHEGTDIFASYGTPVKSTTYGVVELKGWNLYGGWRIGIRDIYNIYHYYAHLNGYNDDIKVGDVVKPGNLLGSVGSTGYGPPGTAGKFPPHLHYGMYQDNGREEWSFDPYPYLIKWERIAKEKRKNN